MCEFIKKHLLVLIYFLIELITCILLIFKLVKDVNIFRYSQVIIDFIASIVIFIFYKSKKSAYFCVAFFMICLADYGLVILGDHYELSVAFFLFAQIALMLMLKIGKIELLIRLIVIVVLEVIAFIICKDLYSPLVILSMLYLATFSANIIYAIIKKEHIMFIIGMILYMLCDICVGISNFELFTNEVLIDVCAKLIFIFYIPGLFLMVIGVYLSENRKRHLCKSLKEKNI